LKKNSIIIIIILICAVTLLFNVKNNDIKVSEKKQEKPKQILPETPYINENLTQYEIFRNSSSFIYYRGESKPGIISKYDIAVLNPKMWSDGGIKRLKTMKTIPIAECSVTRVDGDTPLFKLIPDELKKRAEGPKPTLIMEIEDLWLSMLKTNIIKKIMYSGYAGIQLNDLNLVGKTQGEITDFRLFLSDLKLEFPGIIIIFSGNFETAKILTPLIDGYSMLGFYHGSKNNELLGEKIRNLNIPVVFTIDFIDLQYTDKVSEAFKNSRDEGFIPFIGKNPDKLVQSSKLPPESGEGYLKIKTGDSSKSVLINGTEIKRINKYGYYSHLVKKAYHKIEYDSKNVSVPVIPGRTSFLDLR